MNGRLKVIFVSCALFFVSWTSSALGQGLSSSTTPSGGDLRTFSVIEPIVTTVGNTTFNKITFEGVGNNQPIGTIGGAAFSNNCLGIIDEDNDGSGNFANEPSPSTIAYFLVDGGCTVSFAEPVSGVSIFYTSTVPVTLKAFNGETEVASAVGTANVVLVEPGPGDPTGAFAFWTSLEVSAGTNTITSVQILGVNNQTGFDDFTFARTTFLEPFEAVSAEVVSQAGPCTVRRILGERNRTDQILTDEGSGCVTTIENPQIFVNGVPVATGTLFISPDAQITFEGSHKYCWPNTAGSLTCVRTPAGHP